jgi:hypothetical protein
MKKIIAIIIAAAIVAPAAWAADGNPWQEVTDQLAALVSADAEQAVRLAALEAEVQDLQVRLARVELCTLRRPLTVRPIPGSPSPYTSCRGFPRR